MHSVGSTPVAKRMSGRALVATLQENFVANLRSLMDERGYQHDKDFAKDLGVSNAAVSKWLNKVDFPDHKIIDRIAKLFDVPYERLVQTPGLKANLQPTRQDLDAVLRDFARIRGFNLVKKI